MKEEIIISLLCVVSVGFLLVGLGLILLSMFAHSETNFLPYALGCIILGNVLNVYRTIRQSKNK